MDEFTDDDESAKNEDIVAHNVEYMNKKKKNKRKKKLR